MNTFRIGIDLGSTTAKLVVLDSDERSVFSIYRRHHAETRATLLGMLSELQNSLGDIDVSLMFTGSAGLGVSESYAFPFLQEVIAAAEVIKRCPGVHTLIDIGGEDAKMIFFEPGLPPDIRMNGSCAGGTGAFIDQMATLLNLPVESLEEIARGSTTVYPIASRCGVFAKTDVQNLLSRDIPHPDILASVFNAVVYQILATLARGRVSRAQVLFCGGPLTFIPCLREKFMAALNMNPADVAEIDHPELISALGAALACEERSSMRLSELSARLRGEQTNGLVKGTRLAPLFDDDTRQSAWEQSRMQSRVRRVGITEVAGKPVFLGIDSGSTTTKVCLVDSNGSLLFSDYRHNRGNALQTACDALAEVRVLFDTVDTPPYIARSAVTGYGEDLLRAAFRCDDGVVETLAHFRAAQTFEPRTSFILDIGGQDMKAIFTEQGQIRSIEINEACSSGCGTFIELFANTMGYQVGDFARKALESPAPCDLGTRCTVFMNSKVKQALREGASVADISAGLAYSVIKNAMHKVLKVTDPAIFGDYILLQGGTFRNPAVHRALEKITGRRAICPDIAELMGAYGAALLARDAWVGQQPPSTFADLQNLDIVEQTQKKLIHCRGCENRCTVTRMDFPNSGNFYTGNRCEKIYTNSGKHSYKGANMPSIKYRLLFERPMQPKEPPRAVIGIPRALNLYENFPFWCTLLVESGFRVHLSAPSKVGLYEKGAGTITSENICFPAKITHGHIFDLIEIGVDRIFFPEVTYENEEFVDSDGTFNCPVVGGYPELIQSAIDPASLHGIPLDKPAITFKDFGLMRKGCVAYLTSLGVDKKTARRAFELALAAQREYKAAVRREGEAIIRKARAEGRPMVMMLTRPYHVDPQIHHKAPDILTDFGVDVLTEDSISYERDPKLENRHVVSLWQFSNRCLYAARWAGQQPDVEVVQINSFGCGPDAISVDEARHTMAEWQKGHTVIRVDEIESTGSMRLRLRSMVESMRWKQKAAPLEAAALDAVALNSTQAGALIPISSLACTNRTSGMNYLPGNNYLPRPTTPAYQKADRRRTILVSDFSRFATLPIIRPMMDQGFRMEILPPPDRESVEIGLKYTNNEICYPAILVVGDIIKALQTGRYDPGEVAVGISQTGGQCRDSCYLTLIKNGLVSAGYTQVPVIAASTNFHPINEQPGAAINYPSFIYKILLTVSYADSISAMYHTCAARELIPGSAWGLANEWMERLNDPLMRIAPAEMLDLLKQAVQAFDALPVREGRLPVVGVVGEIYVKLNTFGGGNVVPWLLQQGIEVILPPLTEYFTSNFVNWSVDLKQHLLRPNWVWALSQLVEQPMEHYLRQVDRLMQSFRFYRPASSIWHMAEKASHILDLTNHYGEGWLIPGSIAELVENDVKNILCLQPFGCLANHIVAKGVQNRIKKRYPDINLLFLDCDAGNSEVNFFNRLHFFLHHAKQLV